MSHPENLREDEPSGLSRFAIPVGAIAAPLSADLVAEFDAAVAREHFDYEGPEQED